MSLLGLQSAACIVSIQWMLSPLKFAQGLDYVLCLSVGIYSVSSKASELSLLNKCIEGHGKKTSSRSTGFLTDLSFDLFCISFTLSGKNCAFYCSVLMCIFLLLFGSIVVKYAT